MKGSTETLTYLQDQITTRMHDKKLNARALERMAGLKISAVRNILAGKSNNPGIEVLLSIAGIFECSIDELVGNKSHVQNHDSIFTSENIVNKIKANYPWNTNLYHDALNITEKLVSQQNMTVNSEKMLFYIREIYLYSLKARENTVDLKFAQWIIGHQSN